MTTILATRRNGVTTLAADRCWTAFDGRAYVQSSHISKIIRKSDWLAVAAAGNGVVVAWFEAAKPPATLTVTNGHEAYIAVRKWWSHFLKEHRDLLDREDFDRAFTVLATPWWVAQADTLGSMLLQDDPDVAMAVGSGADYALGAYTVERDIAQAIAVAAKYDRGTSHEFDSVTFSTGTE